MRILAFAGSTSSTSINRELVKYTLTFFGDDDVNLTDLNDFTMPLFSVDEEKKGYPEQAHRFLKAIEEADAIICSFAEHNGNFAVGFKNVFDWASRINKTVFQNKPMLLMATSPGGYGGGNVLETAQRSLPRYGANIKEVFSLPKFGQNFEIGKGIVEQELKEKHAQAVENFINEIQGELE